MSVDAYWKSLFDEFFYEFLVEIFDEIFDLFFAELPVYLRSTLSMSVDAYWKSLLCELKIMTERPKILLWLFS